MWAIKIITLLSLRNHVVLLQSEGQINDAYCDKLRRWMIILNPECSGTQGTFLAFRKNASHQVAQACNLCKVFQLQPKER